MLVFFQTNMYAQTRSNSWLTSTYTGTYMAIPKDVDFDSDGDIDLVISENGVLNKYMNNGSGSFTNVGTIPGIRYCGTEYEFGDIDMDGDADMVLPYNEFGGVTSGKIYLNNGTGTFTQIAGTFINYPGSYDFETRIMDFNNDGKNDIIYLGTGAFSNPDRLKSIEVWLNTSTSGNISFTLNSLSQFTYIGRYSYDMGDVDGDGDLDVVSGGASWGNEVMINTGNGFVSQFISNDYTANSFLLDFDFDGDKDIVFYDSYNNSGLRWRKNNGSGVFEQNSTLLFNNVQVGIPLSTFYSFVLVDVNKDGFMDGVLNGYYGTRVMINLGCSFVLQTPTLGLTGSHTSGMTVADLNNDTFPDLICSHDSYTKIYINDLLQTTAVSLSNITTTTPYFGPTGNISVSASASNNGTVRWWNSSTGGSLIGTGNVLNASINGNTTFYASAINSNGCESSRIPVSATIGVIINVDVTKPTVITKNISIYLDNSGIASIAANDINNGSSDNIGIVSLTIDKSNFDCSNIGENTVKLTATDAAGNSASANAIVNVIDNINPVAISKNISINLSNGIYTLDASEINDGSYDNCRIVSMNVYPNTFNCSSVSPQVVNFVIQDASGNYAATTAIITISASTPNVSVSGSTATVNQAANTIYIGYGTQSINLNATSSNSNLTYSWSPSTGLSNPNIANPVASPSSSTNYTVTVSNSNGCSASASIYINVNDVRSRNSKGQLDGKVLICHIPPGNPSNSNTLSVAPSAVSAHLAHGDKLGTCGSNRNGSEITIETENHINVEAFPNPFNKSLSIYVNSHSDEIINVRIYDTQGKLVYNNENVTPLTILNIEQELLSGVFMLETIQGSERKTMKIVKSN